MDKITWDSHTGGFTAFKGPAKIAVLTTHHDKGLNRNGAVVQELMSKASWTLHLCSPAMHVDDFKALVAALPEVDKMIAAMPKDG